MATKKSSKNKRSFPVKDLDINSNRIKGLLNDWAHAGTAQSIENLKNFIKNEDNKELRAHARLALGEAQYFYYDADNQNEEKQLLLAKMIREEESALFNLVGRQDAAEHELKRLALDKKVYAQILKNKKYDKNKQEDWEYRFSEDYQTVVKHKLWDIENDINYKISWIEEANKLITVERYKNISPEVCESIHFDGEGQTFWVDEPFCEDDYDEYENIEEPFF
jgi:hypothetical protein